MKLCSNHACSSPYYARGLCFDHWQKYREEKGIQPVPRSKEDPKVRFARLYTISEDGCWNWNMPREDGRAGTFLLGKVMSAYRASYIMFNGSIAEGLLVCHSCDNGRCVNPAHLWVGTYFDNNHDSINKGRNVILRGEARGKSAKLTEQQVREIKSSHLNGNRLSKIYGVNRRTIYDILDGKTWTHV